jgi:GH25 family lysozyme M1 (1,4-beta-N-acetylmuramidase)
MAIAGVDALWGRSTLLYTDPSFAVAIGFDPAWAQRRLWLASYQSPPDIPAPSTSCVMQQTTGGGGKLPSGVPVDTDIVADEATL